MIKIGLIGVGNFGRHHLRNLLEIKDFEVVGIFDTNPDAAKIASESTEIRSFESAQFLIDAVDAVDIVTPAHSHFAIAEMAIRQGKHVFIEKPIATSAEDARKLLALSQEFRVKIACGYIERFSPAIREWAGNGHGILGLTAERVSNGNVRSPELSVVFDMMIHDIDLSLMLVKLPVVVISAGGEKHTSPTTDYGEAVLRFGNGVVVKLVASRGSGNIARKLTIESNSGLEEIDLYAPGSKANPLRSELSEFAEAILYGKNLTSSLADAAAGIAVAERIEELINSRENPSCLAGFSDFG